MVLTRPPRGGRRGNLIVTAFFIVLGMSVLAAGIQTMLSQQIYTANQMQAISLARLQAYYLAEMGLNYVMFNGNLNQYNYDKASDTTSDPFSFITTTSGKGTRFDFKPNVAIVRSLATGQAYCTVFILPGTNNTGNRTFQVQAHLVCTAGTFDRIIQFVTQKKVGTWNSWILTGFQVIQ